MRISEAARRLGTSARMLRYREDLGLLPQVRDPMPWLPGPGTAGGTGGARGAAGVRRDDVMVVSRWRSGLAESARAARTGSGVTRRAHATAASRVSSMRALRTWARSVRNRNDVTSLRIGPSRCHIVAVSRGVR